MYKLKKVVNVEVLPQIGNVFTDIDLTKLNPMEKILLRDCLNSYKIHAESIPLKEEILSKL